MPNKSKFLPTQRYLEDEIRKIKVFLSTSEYKYLKTLLNLDISVLNDSYYNEDLEKYEIFKKLALYNICKRSNNLISQLDLTDNNLISHVDSYSFYTRLDSDDNKLLFANANSFSSSHVKKPYNVYFHSKIESRKQEIDFLKSIIENINTGKKRNSDGSVMTYRERQTELINLNKKLSFLETCDDEIINIYNRVNECLEEDFNIVNTSSTDKKLVRSLSFVDVFEKRF